MNSRKKIKVSSLELGAMISVFLLILVIMFLSSCGAPKKTADRPDSLVYPDVVDTTKTVAPEPLSSSLIAFPRISSLTYTIVSYTSDTSKVQLKYTATGLRTGDSVAVKLARSSPPGLLSITQKSKSFSGSFEFKTPRINGKKASYWSCSYIQRRRITINTKCIGWDTSWPPVVVPVDTTVQVASYVIHPDSAHASRLLDNQWKAFKYTMDSNRTMLLDSLGKPLPFSCPQAGPKCGQVQFCVFTVFKDGKWGMSAAQKPECQNEYNLLAANLRSVSPAQQKLADLQCWEWIVVGKSVGSITTGVCSTEPSGNPS